MVMRPNSDRRQSCLPSQDKIDALVTAVAFLIGDIVSDRRVILGIRSRNGRLLGNLA